jgi:hypothetical protein
MGASPNPRLKAGGYGSYGGYAAGGVELANSSSELGVKRCRAREAGDAAPEDASMIDLITRTPVGEAGVRTVAHGFKPWVRPMIPIL